MPYIITEKNIYDNHLFGIIEEKNHVLLSFMTIESNLYFYELRSFISLISSKQ